MVGAVGAVVFDWCLGALLEFRVIVVVVDVVVVVVFYPWNAQINIPIFDKLPIDSLSVQPKNNTYYSIVVSFFFRCRLCIGNWLSHHRHLKWQENVLFCPKRQDWIKVESVYDTEKDVRAMRLLYLFIARNNTLCVFAFFSCCCFFFFFFSFSFLLFFSLSHHFISFLLRWNLFVFFIIIILIGPFR